MMRQRYAKMRFVTIFTADEMLVMSAIPPTPSLSPRMRTAPTFTHIEIIDEIRSRAGLKPYSGKLELMDEIMTQRCGELFGEGYLYHDFVRNNWFPNDFLMPQLNYEQEAYYWPVSSNILSKNWQIQQTPFWNGKTQW